MQVARRGALDALLTRYDQAPFSYSDVGATAGSLPSGYHHVHRRTLIGHGSSTFERASGAVFSWDMHRRAGLSVSASGAVEPDRTVVLGLGLGVALVIPCRVVYVVSEQSRRGFGYGTLVGHPEQGEESFLVTRDEADAVWLDITAFSRPGTTLIRLAGPLGRAAQHIATGRYVRAVRTAITDV